MVWGLSDGDELYTFKVNALIECLTANIKSFNGQSIYLPHPQNYIAPTYTVHMSLICWTNAYREFLETHFPVSLVYDSVFTVLYSKVFGAFQKMILMMILKKITLLFILGIF